MRPSAVWLSATPCSAAASFSRSASVHCGAFMSSGTTTAISQVTTRMDSRRRESTSSCTSALVMPCLPCAMCSPLNFAAMLRIVAFLAGLAVFPAGAQIAGIATRDGVPTLAPVLEKVTPAVVNIAVLQRSPEEQNPMMRDPFFRRFFGIPGESQPQIAAGFGAINDAKNGYGVTNAHGVKAGREIPITLKDNRRLPAKLVGTDAGTDIALLKVEQKSLAEVKWGDSDALQVGDFVLAIGNPFGIGQT